MLLDAQDLVASDKGGHFELRRLTPPSCEVPRPLWGEVPRSVWGAAGGRSLTCLSRRPEGRFLLLLPPHPRSVAEHPGVLPGLVPAFLAGALPGPLAQGQGQRVVIRP